MTRLEDSLTVALAGYTDHLFSKRSCSPKNAIAHVETQYTSLQNCKIV